MILYILLYCILLFSTIYVYANSSSREKNLTLISPQVRWCRFKTENVLFFMLSLFVVMLPALRAETVGTDTANYIHYFLSPNNGYNRGQDIEIGYSFYNKIFSGNWKNQNAFIFISTIIAFSGIYFFIYKNSTSKVFSLFFFTIIGVVGSFYTFYFSGIRQSMAVSFCLVALHFFVSNQRKSLILSVIFYLIGVLFHSSALICLPVLLVSKIIPFSKKSSFFYILGSFFLGFIFIRYNQALTVIINFIFESRLTDYLLADELYKGHRQLWNILPLTLIAIFCIANMKQDILDSLYTKFFIVGVVLNNLLSSIPMSFRMTFYFTILVIIIIPNVVIKKRTLSSFLFICFIVSYYTYKIAATLLSQYHANSGNVIVPYKSFL